MERIIARVCREAGARVRTNTFVRDLNVPGVLVTDDRHIEIIAEGLPLYAGRQLAIDATLVAPLTREGAPRGNSHSVDGHALREAIQAKYRTYADIVRTHR